jgi:hypothetical protein
VGADRDDPIERQAQEGWESIARGAPKETAMTARHLTLVAASLTVAAFSASAAQITLAPLQDTTIFADNLEYASGAGSFLFVGNIASGSPRRALLRFDLSLIPAGSVVTSVTLQIFVDRNGIGSSNTDVAALHRVTQSWGEGLSDGGKGGGGTQASPEDATWAYRFYGDPAGGVPRVPWSVAGGTFEPAPSGETLLSSTGPLTFQSSPGLVADVQGWIDDPAGNAGWIMLGDETRDQAVRRLRSGTSAAIDSRPALTIVYAPVPEPATYAALLAGLAVLGTIVHRRK